jgi:hypothetical protein
MGAIEYRGYRGAVRYSSEDRLMHGRILLNGNLLFSMSLDGGTLGGLTLRQQDLVEWDAGAEIPWPANLLLIRVSL